MIISSSFPIADACLYRHPLPYFFAGRERMSLMDITRIVTTGLSSAETVFRRNGLPSKRSSVVTSPLSKRIYRRNGMDNSA